MKGPLQTVIRNLTDKPLTYPACKLFVKPNSEFLLPFDPFTKYEASNALERLLIDVKQGKALIIYLYDGNYAAATPVNSVQLSLNAQRILNTPVIEQPKAAVKKEPARMEGTLPPGELPEAPKIEREKLDKHSRVEQKVSQAAADAAGIGTEPEEDEAKNIDKMLEEQSLHREPDPVKDPQKEEPVIEPEVVAEQPAKKGGRKKKEVVTL